MGITVEELRGKFPGVTGRCAPEGCEDLLGALVERNVSAGEVLMAYGSPTDTLYMVREGSLSVYIEEEGRKLVLGQAGPGMVVGEIGMIEPGPASATVAALEESALLTLSHGAFEALRDQSPATAAALLESLSMDLVLRLRHASSGLWRIDENHWMKLEARKDHKGWIRRLATLMVGLEDH